MTAVHAEVALALSCDGARVPRHAPVVLGLPAMGVAAGYYEPFARALAKRLGASVAWAELRGQGTSRHGPRDDFGYREIVEHDLPAVIRALRARHPGRPLYLLGHSLGGQLAAIGLHQWPEVEGLVLIASGSAWYRAWPLHWRPGCWALAQTAALATWLLGRYPGRMLRFGGNQPRRLMRDWYRAVMTGRYRFDRSTVDHEARARDVTTPVHAIAIAGDSIAPPGAVRALLAKFPRAPTSYVELACARNHGARRRHFAWVREHDAVVDATARWIERIERVRIARTHPVDIAAR